LLNFGIDVPEAELRVRCDSTILGTDALKAVDVARQLGFTHSAKYTLTLDELRELSAAGPYPHRFVSLLPIDAHDDVHSVVVFEITREELMVLDPLSGQRAIPLQTFSAAWGLRHNLALFIKC
jgi:ABC-type bacteriocin/lantibiotic exporter with double-glycine peptidase domain